MSKEDTIDVIAFIMQELKAFDPNRIITAGETEEQARFEAMHISTLERLERLNEELIKKGSEFREKIEADYQEKKNSLDAQTEKIRAQHVVEYLKKNSEAEKVKEQLEKRLREVDDRDNTHVRRGLREALQQEIIKRQQAFCLTKGTQYLRIPIHAVCLMLILAFAGASVWYSSKLYAFEATKELNLSLLIIMALKPLGLAFATIGISIFYIKWMNQWFEHHSAAEFHLKQFQLDVDRASWVVETTLEWKRALKDVIPTVLLDSITRNLFKSDDKPSESPMHPADQLASALLGTASKVRVQVGDTQLEFEGKNLKKEMGDNK
ncbi:MAG: hypothetical protein NTX50_01725 [Candidatus Sumerlaeota bacterium]|nr:hypothetical protein [Candidatus Sumerlaeota bacterium]